MSMNYAVIDLGSNTIRLSVYGCEGGQCYKIFSQKEVAGLAGYVSNGFLEMAGIQKACAILNSFHKIASKLAPPENIHLFATASLRNIENRGQAVRMIAGETSLIPDVLTGDEEAAFGFAGVSQVIRGDSGLMIDIGGASTELVVFKDRQPVHRTSIPFGCLNLYMNCVHDIMPTNSERKQIKQIIKEQFSRIDWNIDGRLTCMVGIGGTMRAALKLSRALFNVPYDQNEIHAGCVKEISEMLENNLNDIHHTVYKTIPDRLHTIAPGLSILKRAIKTFGCEIITVSEFGIREGYLAGRVLKQNDVNPLLQKIPSPAGQAQRKKQQTAG